MRFAFMRDTSFAIKQIKYIWSTTAEVANLYVLSQNMIAFAFGSYALYLEASYHEK